MRFLLCPLGSPGFSFPVIAIGRQLVAKGHVVAFATAPWLAPLLRGQGFTWIPAEPDDGSSFDTSRWHDPAAVAGQLRHLEHALQRFKPDVIVTSVMALGPLIVGEKTGIPVAVLGLMTPLLPQRGRRAEFQVALDRCQAHLGLAPVAVERMYGDLYLTRGVPELIEAPHLVGSCAWEPPIPKLVECWLAAVRQEERRVIYVHQARGFGAPGFWPLLTELPPDVRIVASTSRMDGGLMGAPEGALIGAVVPQAAVMRHAAAVVCSGTTAVVLGSMECGVPLVVVPAGGEQFDVAVLVEQAGIGASLPVREATSEQLAATLEGVLKMDPTVRTGLQQAFARIDGPTHAASLIERL